VLLACVETNPHGTSRADFARDFFAAGGFDVVAAGGLDDVKAAARAFCASGSPVAVVCCSEESVAAVVPQLAARLKSAGARSVVLAVEPGTNEQALRSAGVDRFIFEGCDVARTLHEMLGEQGVSA
jgi:methylmalonyl-CoA mutase